MSRLQATIKITEVSKKDFGGNTMYEISGYESCFSFSRKKAQERHDIDKGKTGGRYNLFHTIKAFAGSDAAKKRLDMFEKGDVIDFCGQYQEDAWISNDGTKRKSYFVENPDIKKVFSPDSSSRNEQQSKSPPPQDEEDLFGSSSDDDDIPF